MTDMEGQRLDAALLALAPHLSLRGRRRLIERGGVLVNGKPGRPGQRLRAHDVVELADVPAGDMAPAPDNPQSSQQSSLQSDAQVGAQSGPQLVAVAGDFAVLCKPAGMHSVSLAGSASPSLEAALASLLPQYPAARLLQRLDRQTSGLVCVALTDAAAASFRQWEARGQCHKRYVALLRGTLAEAVTATSAIDTSNRRTSRILPEDAPPLRHTSFVPLAHGTAGEMLPHWPDSADIANRAALGQTPVTLAGCVIHRGCRHQIRAHAASLGHALLGDALYGSPEMEGGDGGNGADRFFLHAAAIAAPAVRQALPPAWGLAPPMAQAVEKWLENLPRYGV